MEHRVSVLDDGEITIPSDLLENLGWRVGDDVEMELAEAGLVMRRRQDHFRA